MIDPMLFSGTEEEGWSLDINIVNGYIQMMEVPQQINTNKQRKAVLAYQVADTIPGNWERGVNWPNMINEAGMMPLAEAMTQVQLAVGNDEGASAENSFTIPIIGQNSESANIQLLTVSPDDIKELQNG